MRHLLTEAASGTLDPAGRVTLEALILAFFRDPRRVTPLGDNLIISPADGLVTLIKQMDAPRELVVDDGTQSWARG